MNDILAIFLTGIFTLAGSSGVWAYFSKKDTNRSATERMVMGLAYKEIISLGFQYIERGWITQDEYEEYRKYLYEPYKAMGGNGVAERVVAAVANLPIRSRAHYANLIEEAKTRRSSEPALDDELVHSASGRSAA